MNLPISPFRYPGAKRRLLPQFISHLVPDNVNEFLDLFVGGGSVALAVAHKYPDLLLVLNDLDYGISAFWECVVKDRDSLCSQILTEPQPTLERFYEIKESKPSNKLEAGFRRLYLNRTSFSGLGVNPIGGKNQASNYSVDCRWSASRLVKQILVCEQLLKGRTRIYNSDALTVPWANDAAAYLDPPYVEKGPQLYGITEDKLHLRLAAALQFKCNWTLSYDDCPEVRSAFSWARIKSIYATYSVREGDNRATTELIIHPPTKNGQVM